jgi:dTDP-glucose 4,6-dehydratase
MRTLAKVLLILLITAGLYWALDIGYGYYAGKIQRELGWRPRHNFEDGLRQTVRWYLDNRAWWERVMSGAYRGERLGLTS